MDNFILTGLSEEGPSGFRLDRPHFRPSLLCQRECELGTNSAFAVCLYTFDADAKSRAICREYEDTTKGAAAASPLILFLKEAAAAQEHFIMSYIIKTSFLAIASLSCLAYARAVLPAAPDAADCVALTPGGPLQITPECVDPTYRFPVIDAEADFQEPVPHHRISGHFNGTNVDFNLYLPGKSAWQGRFFQHVYPLQNSTAPEREFTFGIDSGAYWVKVKGTLGYRADAAVAKLSRQLAREYYDEPDRQIYGYVYGGSGGSLQTVGGMENTVGVWDGALVLIQAVPASNPNNFCIRALGGIVLDGKSKEIADAVSPGGSGNPLEALNELERAVWEEVTAFGVPVKVWEDFDDVARNGTRTRLWEALRTLIIPSFKNSDSSYVDDFWTKPGYAGTEDSQLGEFFRSALVTFNSTVRDVHRGSNGVPVAFSLDNAPASIDPKGLEYFVQKEDGTVGSFFALLDGRTNEAMIYGESDPAALAALDSGSELTVNNRWWLSVHTCHRHQLTSREGYYGFDYFRGPEGKPLYPQREVELAPIQSERAAGGGTHTGKFNGKMIVMDNLLDYDALPWHADWYRNVVREAIGDEAFEDNYRLYYADNADHYMGPVDKNLQARIVDFTGLWEQHLRDLATWVEQDIAPPAQTRYSLNFTQVELPATACHRRGIQPIINLTVEGKDIVQVGVGERVMFNVYAEAPPATGKIVSLEWDPEGTGGFAQEEFDGPARFVEETATHVFQTPGTYFPVVRVGSHRQGNASSPFARSLNLSRVRVVVS